MRFGPALALVFLLVAGPARAEDDARGDLGRLVPLDNQVTDDGTLEWVVVRVLDAWTRRPVAGATVDVVHEARHPAPSRHPPMAKARTDAEGWARIRLTPAQPKGAWPHWTRAHHPDYASVAKFRVGGAESPLFLWPREQAEVEVVDPLGRPVAGALLDYLLGCGHCPTVLQTRTDARGVGHLRGIQSESLSQTWLVADRLYAEYVEHADWRPGDPPLRHRAEWAHTWSGRVVDGAGRPLEGVAIGTPEFHRGPWAHSDADGRFQLRGVDEGPGSDVQFGMADCTREGWARDMNGEVTLPLPGVPILLRLPGPPPEDSGTWWDLPEAPAGKPVAVDVAREDGTPTVEIGVVASRVTDGRTVTDLTNVEGRATLELQPGTWIVATNPGRPGREQGLFHVQARVEVTADGAPKPVELTLPTPRQLRLSLAQVERTTVHVVTETLDYEVTEPARAGEAFQVPATGAVHLSVEFQGFAPRVLRVPDAALVAGAEPLVIAPPARTAVQLIVRDTSGQPVKTWARPVQDRGVWRAVVAQEPDGEPTSQHEVLVDPQDTPWIAILPPRDALLAPALYEIPPGTRAGAQLDIAEVRLQPIVERRLRIDVGGTSPQARRVRKALKGERLEVLVVAPGVRLEGRLALDHDDGRVRWSDDRRHGIPAGATVTVLPKDEKLLPQRVVAPSEGDIVIPWPTGEVELSVVGPADEVPEDTRMLFDGTPLYVRESVQFAGVAPGSRSVLVSAPGHASQRIDLEVVSDQTVVRRIVLRALPVPK